MSKTMHKPTTAAMLLGALLCAAACKSPPSPTPPAKPQDAGATVPAAPTGNMHIGAYAPGTDGLPYATGTSGTYTVPTGVYVTGLSCYATAGGASLTITPSGPSITDAQAGAIAIAAGQGFSLGRPWLAGNANELGAGSVLAFSGTASYFIAMYAIGAP